MAYQPEIMRPELQRANGNRNGLNIQQPGEDNWKENFGLSPEDYVDRSKSFGLGDVLPSVGVGAAQSVQGTGELARGLGDGLVNSPVKTAARIENELLKLWSPGVSTINDIIPGAGKSVDETIDALPDGKNAVTDAIGKGLKVTGKGVSDVAGAVKDWSYDKMSPGAQRALNTPMSEGWDDSAVWVAKGTNLIGSLLPDLAAGGLTKKVGEVALKKALTSGLEKKFIASGLAPEKAGVLAAKAVEEKMPDLFQAGMVTSSTASAQGSAAMNAAQSILNADYSELSKSPKFQDAFYAIDDDPQYAELSDRQKMDMAKERVADEVRAQLATDPQSLIVNALAAKLGDAQLVNLALRGTAKSVASGVARNMAEQAGINAAQGGFSRYQENAALRDTAGMDVPEWQGVGDAAFESGVMGSALGAPFGAIAGYRGKRQAEAGINARKDASRQAMDEKAARAQQMAENSPYTKPADPVEGYRQQFSGLSRDELLQHYADADLAHENDVDAVYRKHAANGLLKEMDRADQLKGIVDEMQGKPRNEVLKEYRDLNEKDKRNETEQMRWEAARQVLKPQPKAPAEQPQPAEAPQKQSISVPTVRFGDDIPHIEITSGAPRPPERIEKVHSSNNYFTDARSAKNSDVFRHAEQTGLKPEVVKKGERQYAVEMDNPQISEDRARETINTLAMGERIPDKRKTTDPMEIPAFMRDPRFRNFTDEPTEVQQHLTRGNAPTPEELVHEQMAKGDAGPTDYELAERPRLPPPGDIHPGQGYPLPGEVRHMPDESPAGRGGRYTTTGEVRGQSYEKGRQTVAPEGVQRQGEAFQGELSHRELPAPERTEVSEPESREPATAEQPDHTSHEQERQAEAQRPEEDVAKKLAEKKERETQERNDAIRKRKERLSSYLDSVDEKRRDIARDFLHQGLNNPFGKGQLYISDLVEKRVDDGWRIKKDKDGRPQRLVGSNGESLDAGDITQYGLDYADHILRTEKSGEKIDDFGEVIHGAAKHRRAALAEELNTDKTAEDYHTQPFSKLFPKPDYEKMAAEGTDNKTLAMLALLRSMIPAKPRVAHRLNRWAKQVEEVRDTAGQLLDGSLPTDKFIDRIRQERGSHYSEIVKTWEMLHRLSPAQLDQAAGYRVKSHAYSMFDGKEYNPPKVFHTLENGKGRRVLDSDDLDDLSKKAKAYFDQQAASPEPADSKTKLDIYQNRRTGEVFIAYGKNKTPLQGGFKTAAEARDYVKNNRAELLEKLNKLREQSREEQRNASNRDRTGPERREGDVTPDKFSDAFGFRGVQFGNYVEGPRRQSDLNRAYDSLMDMADVLKVPAKALSLNGRLGLAFGARGKGGKNAAAAHYEPDQVAINLTKGNGAGSLAHEWFHALDNYFGQHDIAQDGNVVSGDNFMTRWNGKAYASAEHPVRREVHDAFKGVVNAVNKSGMVDRARRLDEVRSKPYWSTDIEMAARAFERYVQDKAKAAGVENDFLVNIRKADDHGSPDTYAYPTNEELDGGIRQAFDHLFSTLKTRETDKGVAFYSREKGNKTLRTSWQKDFPDVVLHARLGDATMHRDYEAAKGGDEHAARRLVSEVLSKDAVDKIRDIIGNRHVLLTAVHAEESSGRNKIPQAMADMLGHILHQAVDDNIVQAKRVGRTGQDGFGRLANQPEFAGNVRSDLPYFIVDDTLTQGGTLAGLKGYIESHGGRVIGASALTGKQYSARMALSPQTLSQLREHFGGTGLENWWKQQHGYDFDGLTESEANYLLRAGDADKIRDRVLAARQTGDSYSESGSPEAHGSLPPDVKSRYAKKASDTGGFSVIGDGNLLSETGHSADAKGSSVAKVKAVARGVMDRIKDNTLNVRVVKSQAEAQELAGESFDGYGKVHAFYRPDEHEIVLVADNIPDGRTVREKLRHEIIHHAMEQVVTPAEYKTIVDNVLKTRSSDNAAIREMWRNVDADYGNESPEVQAGEFLAHMAEKEPGKLGAAWNRVVALIKAVLRRTGLFQPSDLNDIGYIRDTIRTLGQRVRKGYVPREGGDVSYSRTGKPDPFRVPEGDGERYRRDLAKAVKSHRSSDISITIGRTPPVLRHIGAPDLPLVISRDTVRKATNGVKHDVPMDVIEQLPELMHDPEAVYQSATEKNAVVMLFDAVDKNGDPVIGAVHLKADKKGLEINKVASVYGAFPSKMSKMDREGLALYKKQNPDNQTAGVLQLHGDSDHQGSVNKILSPDDIRKGPYYSRSRSALSPEETLAARFVRRVQDKFQVLKAVQDNIRKSGGKLDDSNNAYLAEELFHGKAENDLNVMKERYVKPMANLLAQYDIPQSALDEYLYARHAPERNAHIAEINPKMPDGGSGMTNAEAAGIMDRVRRSGKQAQYDRLAGIVDDMLARRRELIREAGLETDGTVDAWQDTYKHYVPLKGQDADGTVLPRTGRGYVISGRESKMAMGRKSKAQSPSTQAMQDLTASLIRRRKNEVGNTLLKLVQDNPDKDYWQVFTDQRPDTTRRIVEKKDPATGDTIRQVEEMPVPMAMMSDKYFTTKKDGKTYYIKLHDERLMRAMKNMGPETGNAVIQTLARVNRFMSAMNTSLNPEFLVSNFIRDMQTAVMNLKAEQGRDDGKLNGRDIAMKTVRDSGIAMKAVYASLRDKSLSGAGADWQKTWKEFVEDGAKTGWFRMEDLNGQMKEMDRLVTLAKGGWQGQGIKSWRSFTKLVEDANNAVENALRLSAYKHARDAGISRAQAASLAKNMTVNFNRRGEQGILLNSLYMFANASIQGTANMMRSLAHLNGSGPLLERLRWGNLNMAQKLALTATGAGYLLASLNRAGAGQDGDGENWYDKVPDYVKEHNVVIMKSLFGGKAGEYWSIPLPYGYNMFYLLGSTAEGVTRGNMTASKAAGNIVGGMLGAFNPLGSEDSKTLTGTLFKNAAPTILRPVADLWANENFMGTQIYQENFPGGTPKPESTLGRRSTPEAYKAFAGWLNRATGGSQYRSGALDINPDKMKYWIDYVSGGMGRFAGKTIDAAAKSYNGIDIPPQQIPFLDKISGKVMPYADQQSMYDHIDELRQYDAELKTLRGADRTAFLNKYRGQISMNGIIHQSQIQLKNLRKQRDEIYSDPTLTARQQADRVLMVEQNMKKVVDRFNREYREKVGE
ncbi:LPD38 domain-containing protein [Salmonella enterica]|uniref:LPD38 domain-containing protein n=1 Tax=Salmonella enterica TaxID=28901 RepID=UPI001CBBE9D7|nr:LPD38 domain-containing protein [Salmonella enterica]